MARATGTALSWLALGAYLVRAYPVGDAAMRVAVPLLDRTAGE